MDVHYSQRRIGRLLTVKERFALQGHDPRCFEHFRSDRLANKATGNAFAVQQLAQMLIPMLVQAVQLRVIKRGTLQDPLSLNTMLELSVSGRLDTTSILPPQRKRLRRRKSV